MAAGLGAASSALEAAAELALELDQAADGAEPGGVLFATEGGEHAGVVSEGGDCWPEAGAERLAAGGAAEVVVFPIPRVGRETLDLLAKRRSGAPASGGVTSRRA